MPSDVKKNQGMSTQTVIHKRRKLTCTLSLSFNVVKAEGKTNAKRNAAKKREKINEMEEKGKEKETKG